MFLLRECKAIWKYNKKNKIKGHNSSIIAQSALDDSQFNKHHNKFLAEKKGQNFFISWFTNPPTVIFRRVEKKIISNFFFFILSANFQHYLFRWTYNIFLRFCLSIY